ncbi:unnamed protein product [Clavelina lepadiformis]|uniref:Protein unc-93 homolog A n=1 Tax=Clavelina lepadiformis TaxID=159417 RepID=A0ABP0GC43_CLALP
MKLLVKLYGDKWSWKNIWRRATCRKPIPKRQKPKVGNFALPTGEIVTYEDYVKQMGETPDLLEARPLGWDENKEERRVNKKTRKELFRSLYLAGIGFFLFSYGYHQLSLMQNYLHESEFFMEIKYMPDYMNTYGHVQLLAKYGLAALLGVLVPYLTRVVQDKWILFVGAGGYGLFISLSFLDAKYTIMPSGFLAGLASTPFFTTFSMYMVQLTKRLGDLNQKRPYNGIQSNWMLYILNTFVFGGWFLGYSLSAMTCTVLVFGDMQRNNTYIHTNNLSCGRYHCDKPWPNWWDTMMQEKDIPSIDKYSNANLANACCLILVMGFFLFGCLEGQTTKIWSNLKEKGFELNFKLGFRGVFSWRRTMLAPTFIFMGWATDFIAYTYPKAYTICSLNSWLHYVALAACGFMGSVVAAGAPWLALKRTGWNPILIVAVSCFFICLVILISWTPVASIGGFKYTNVFPAIWEKILFVAVPALWGLGSGALYAAVNVKIQFEYPEPDEMIQMFVLFYHWHAVGVLVGYATRSTATCTGPKLYGLLGTLVLAIVMYVWYEHKRLKQEDALKAEDVKVIRFIPNPHPDKMANESDVEEEGTSTSEEETDDEGNRKKRVKTLGNVEFTNPKQIT